jgi:hypothetical protein
VEWNLNSSLIRCGSCRFDAVAAAGVMGLLGYGISLALFVLALRHLGAARHKHEHVHEPLVTSMRIATKPSSPCARGR